MSAKNPVNGKEAQQGVGQNFQPNPVPQGKVNPVQECKPKHWIGVRVVDEKGKPVVGVKIKLKLPNGNISEDTSDKNGKYTTGKALPAGSCDISLPEEFDLEWKEQ
jgi:hypothetical protein